MLQRSALLPAEQIEQIRDEVQRQKQTIDLVVRDANQARQELAGVRELSKSAKGEVEQFQKLLNRAEEALTELRVTTDFGLLLAEASNDDRLAFNKLVELSQKKDSAFAPVALRAIESIVQDVNPVVQVRVDQPFPWESMQLDPAKADFDTFRELYRTAHRHLRLALLSDLWRQERFPKRQRLEFLCEVIRAESSLRVLHRACVLINTEAHLDMNILGAQQYLDWWENNKARY